MIPHLLQMRAVRGALEGCSSYHRRDTVLSGRPTCEHHSVLVRTGLAFEGSDRSDIPHRRPGYLTGQCVDWL